MDFRWGDSVMAGGFWSWVFRGLFSVFLVLLCVLSVGFDILLIFGAVAKLRDADDTAGIFAACAVALLCSALTALFLLATVRWFQTLRRRAKSTKRISWKERLEITAIFLLSLGPVPGFTAALILLEKRPDWSLALVLACVVVPIWCLRGLFRRAGKSGKPGGDPAESCAQDGSSRPLVFGRSGFSIGYASVMMAFCLPLFLCIFLGAGGGFLLFVFVLFNQAPLGAATGLLVLLILLSGFFAWAGFLVLKHGPMSFYRNYVDRHEPFLEIGEDGIRLYTIGRFIFWAELLNVRLSRIYVPRGGTHEFIKFIVPRENDWMRRLFSAKTKSVGVNTAISETGGGQIIEAIIGHPNYRGERP